MEKIDVGYIKSLAKNLMYELTDDEALDIIEEFETLDKQLKLLEAINTEGVQEMIYPFEAPTSYLREDVVDHVLSQKEVLSNAHTTNQGHFVTPKVVK